MAVFNANVFVYNHIYRVVRMFTWDKCLSWPNTPGTTTYYICLVFYSNQHSRKIPENKLSLSISSSTLGNDI